MELLEPASYPSGVIALFDTVAWFGLVIGILAGVIIFFTAGGGSDSSSLYGGTTSTTDETMQIVMGVAIVIGSVIQWAFFRAAALVVEYLWRIQARVS